MQTEEKPSLGGSLLLPLIHSIAWSDNVEIRRDAAQGLASLSLASENRETIARVGGFDALLSCLCDNDDTAARDTRRPATSGTADVTDATVSSAALKKLTTIVSLKSAAKRAIKCTRHYTIKRLAIECIANLLEERKTHERFPSRKWNGNFPETTHSRTQFCADPRTEEHLPCALPPQQE